MAITGGAARRYARALFDLALSRNADLDEWLGALDVLAQTLGRPDVVARLDAPRTPVADKQRAVSGAIVGLPALLHNFVNLLIERGRMGLINGVAAAFRELVHEHEGIVEASVRTAVPVGEVERVGIARRLGDLTGKRVLVDVQVDPTILGGIIARIGDRLIDASIAGRLEALRADLVAGRRQS